MPLVVYTFVAILCQVAAVGLGLLVDKFGPAWLSIIVFGVLYLAAFVVAWKLTVWLVDNHLRRSHAA